MIDYLFELEERVGVNIVGDNAMICCPFHNDSNPSCGVSLSTGVYHCFSCHVKGQFSKLIAQLDGVSESSVLLKYSEENTAIHEIQEIEKLFVVEDVEKQLYIKIDSFHKKFLSIKDTKGEHYVRGRKISKKTMERFDLRWGTSGKWESRVIIPMYNREGKLLSFSGRSIVSDSKKFKTRKYRSPGNVLFGLNLLPKEKLPYLILVEGEFDAMYLQQFGLNVVSISGTSDLTVSQVTQILGYAKSAVISYDADPAGRKAATRDYLYLKDHLPTTVIKLPRGKDPNSLGGSEVKQIYKEYFKVVK